MPVFTFHARNTAGQRQTGTQDAPSAADVAASLRQRGWLVLDVKPASEDGASGEGWADYLNPLAWIPPRSQDVELSMLQLAVMLRSGLTLLTSLKTVAEHAQLPSMRRVWESVALRIQQGSTLGDAMADHRCFSRLVLQLVRVGESTGVLDLVMTRAAESLEHRRLLRTQILTALAYPSLVLVSAIGVTIFMVVAVIPKLGVFLQTLGRRLPPMTQSLLDLSAFVQVYGLYMLIGFFALTISLIGLYLWPPGRFRIDRFVLMIPILGYLLRLGATVQFAQALNVLLESGITVVEALRTVEKLLGNRFLASLISESRESILRGTSLAAPLTVRKAFMPMLPQMIAVGETAGTLQEVLAEVAKFHESQLRATIRWLSTIIEPVIVVVIGGIVGYVYIAFFIALFSVAGGAR